MLKMNDILRRFYIMDDKQLQFHKMKFIMNALEDGWNVKKRDGVYIFTKKHEKKERSSRRSI